MGDPEIEIKKKCLLNAIFTWGEKLRATRKSREKWVRNQTRTENGKINIYEQLFSNLLAIFASGVFQFPIPWKESRILLHN